MILWVRVLSKVLHVANAAPVLKDDFYDVKDRILRRFGVMSGYDYQEIEHKCWNCDDKGRSHWDGQPCHKCEGSGIYSTLYVELERWILAGRVFHCPIDRYKSFGGYWDEVSTPDWMQAIWRGEVSVSITGKVTHRKYPADMSAEACLWLLLFWSPKVFWAAVRRLPKSRFSFYPLVFLFWLRNRLWRQYEGRSLQGIVSWLKRRALRRTGESQHLPF